MEITQADTKILDWLRKKDKLVIEGNKEYYITLEYFKGKYIYRFGDTAINEDTEVKEMPEQEVLSYLKSHIAGKAKFWHKKDIFLPEDIWKYIQENPHI